ncbi:MAG: biotin/lipoate A/B protein ligase family protein [Candidatus Methanofastidiosia archaeon]|jgi:lipoate-protein ligase A
MEPLLIYPKNELRLLYQHGNPAMCLSVEEAIARSGIPTFRVWTTSKCVVVGRFQDTEKEVDTVFCQQQDIAVLRRFTGGGAVFLDEGVACLSFCLPAQKNPLDIFRALSMCVGETINATIDDKNSLFIDNKKVSGAASCKKWGSLFHHMTVLVGCNLEFMRALTPHKAQGNTASNPCEVNNIPMNMKAILFRLAKNVEALLDCDLKPGKLEQKELDLAERLLKEKYSQAEWNFQAIDPW